MYNNIDWIKTKEINWKQIFYILKDPYTLWNWFINNIVWCLDKGFNKWVFKSKFDKRVVWEWKTIEEKKKIVDQDNFEDLHWYWL